MGSQSRVLVLVGLVVSCLLAPSVGLAPARGADAVDQVRLLNPGFEQADPDRAGMPLGWGVYPGSHSDARLKFVWDDRQAHSGRHSVSIVVGSRNASWLPSETAGYANSLDQQELGRRRPPAVVGHEYILSAWVRAEGSAQQIAVLVLRWTNEQGWVPSYVREYFVLHGNDWQRIAVSATAPEGAKSVVPILQVGSSPEPGRIWFDDVALVDRTGLRCEVRTEPELCVLPARWRCELAVTSSRPAGLPLIVTLQPDRPGAEPQHVKGTVSAAKELRARAEYDSAGPHRLRYSVTSADERQAPYFFSQIAVPSPLEAHYLSPLYRATLYGSASGRKLRIQTRVRATEQLREQLELHATVSVGQNALVQKTFPRPPARGSLDIALPDLPAGNHQVQLRLQAGEQVVAKADLPLHCRPELKPAAALGDHNELLVAGKPTFPLGFYSTLPADFKRFAGEGFNTVLTYTSDAKACAKMTKQADEAGLKLIVSVLRPFVARHDVEGLRQAVREVASLPGLLGYYLWDEPSSGHPGQTPEDMRWVYERAMAADPSHITCTVFCRPSEFKLYADTTDVFMVDPYATFYDAEPDLTKVADWVDQARSAVDDRKPVWLVPQCFGHLLGPGRYRMPTIAEQRCMSYLGLVHGAKGLIWFVYTGFCIHSEEVARHKGLPPGAPAWVLRGTIPACFPLRWEGLKQIVREVNELSPVLLSEDPQQTQRIVEGADEIHCLLKAAGRDRFFLAVNAKNKPVDFKCELPAAQGAVQVLWEDRQIKLDQGLLEDQFEPYAVHVYRFRSTQ